MPETSDEEKLNRFVELVEEKTGQEIYPDTEMGDHIGWFFLNIPLELNGETFDAEVDFDLSENKVTPMYAEICVESGTKREEKLAEAGTRLEEGDEALYEYYLDEGDVGSIIDDLREAHAEVYQ